MERSKQRAYDYALVIVLGIIIVTGLVILYSTSAYNGKLKFQDSFYYLKKQIFATLLGIAGMWIIARVDYHVWKKWSVPGYLVSVLLGIAVLLIGDEYNGSKRWLSLGPFSFQPSEFAKVAVILFLTYVIMRNVKSMGKFTTVCKIVVSVLPVVGLVGASNLSTAIIILGIAVVLVFVASPKYGQFAWMIFLGCAFMGIFLAMESYRLERLQIWRHPENYEKGYQTIQGRYAIGSGGLKGLGLGNSVEKQLWLPESTNDFIFSVVCEELGFVGAVIVILLFVLFLVQGLWLAFHAENRYCTLVGIGIMAQIAWQVFCNIAVVTNTLPNTGISLPFFSSGGTSLILLLAEMGVMINIGRGGERARLERENLRALREQREKEKSNNTIRLDPNVGY